MFQTKLPMLVCGTLVLFGGLSRGLAQEPVVPGDLSEEYRNAERDAPMTDRLDLDTLRATAKQKGWTFKIGYTSVFSQPLDQVAATSIPENFLALAIVQNRLAAKTNGAADESARLSGIAQVEFLGQCKPNKPAFNWRDEEMLSRVEMQGTCGSCWAFSAASAYNGSYKIRNNLGVEISSQHILDCAVTPEGKPAGSCQGGWYDLAFEWMLTRGVADIVRIPYKGKVETCAQREGPYRAVSWGFVTDKTQVPTIRAIKSSLCKYGPLSAAMEATEAFQAYAGGLFNENSDGVVNHAVVIVGWNDNIGGTGKGGWLIKNSWDKRWGEEGYAWVAYNHNKIGYASTWVRPVERNVPVQAAAISEAWQQAQPLLTDLRGLTALGMAPEVTSSEVGPYTASVEAGKATEAPSRKVVWIHYGDADHQNTAKKIRNQLTDMGYLAPAIEEVSIEGALLPQQYQVRYFSDANKDTADAVGGILSRMDLGTVEVIKSRVVPAVDAIEVWVPVNR